MINWSTLSKNKSSFVSSDKCIYATFLQKYHVVRSHLLCNNVTQYSYMIVSLSSPYVYISLVIFLLMLLTSPRSYVLKGSKEIE